MVACFHSKGKLYFCLTPLKNVNQDLKSSFLLYVSFCDR